MNGYLERRRAEHDDLVRSVGRVDIQYDADCLAILLYRRGWNYKKVLEILLEWDAVRDEFRRVVFPSDPECDYWREVMDRWLRKAARGNQDIIPFEERYPELKKVRYGK